MNYYIKLQLWRVFNYITFKPYHMQRLKPLLSYLKRELTAHKKEAYPH